MPETGRRQRACAEVARGAVGREPTTPRKGQEPPRRSCCGTPSREQETRFPQRREQPASLIAPAVGHPPRRRRRSARRQRAATDATSRRQHRGRTPSGRRATPLKVHGRSTTPCGLDRHAGQQRQHARPRRRRRCARRAPQRQHRDQHQQRQATAALMLASINAKRQARGRSTRAPTARAPPSSTAMVASRCAAGKSIPPTARAQSVSAGTTAPRAAVVGVFRRRLARQLRTPETRPMGECVTTASRLAQHRDEGCVARRARRRPDTCTRGSGARAPEPAQSTRSLAHAALLASVSAAIRPTATTTREARDRASSPAGSSRRRTPSGRSPAREMRLGQAQARSRRPRARTARAPPSGAVVDKRHLGLPAEHARAPRRG